MDFNKILEQQQAAANPNANQGAGLGGLRSEVMIMNDAVIKYIDESRNQMDAMRKRISLLEGLLENFGRSLELAEDGIRELNGL
jgi:hypothetical protein